MNKTERNSKIIEILSLATKPISATALSRELGVSRQVVVGDIALLRAQGRQILSHPRGYILQKSNKTKQVFKVKHEDSEVRAELNLIVDLGGVVEDVFVYHKVYGKVSAPMGICSRHDVEQFLKGIESGKSSLLKNVTSGYHYHTVSADSKEVLTRISLALNKSGFLAPLQEFEPEELNDY